MAHQQMNIREKHRPTSKDDFPIRRKLGATIRDFRLMLRMTPNELAWDAGQTEVFISQLEAGEIDVEITALKRIADALQIELSELMLSVEHGHRPILLTDEGR